MLRFLEKHPKHRPHFAHWTENKEYLNNLMMDPDRKTLTPIFISKAEELYNLLTMNAQFLTVVTFVAPWSASCKTIMELIREFVVDPDLEHILFCEITVEDFPEMADKFAIRSVPSVLFFRDNQVCERLIGEDISMVTRKVMEYANDKTKAECVGNPIRSLRKIQAKSPLPEKSSAASVAESHAGSGAKIPLKDRLRKLISLGEVMIFMKGTPAKPRCGFSRQLIEIMKEVGVPFESYDILENEEIRQGLKTYSNWQTYPQIYVKGELIGGLDVIKEMREMGTLDEILGKQDDLYHAQGDAITEGIPSQTL